MEQANWNEVNQVNAQRALTEVLKPTNGDVLYDQPDERYTSDRCDQKRSVRWKERKHGIPRRRRPIKFTVEGVDKSECAAG